MKKQVQKDHYGFQSYMSKARWNSVWHQVDEIVKLNPMNVLEIGPGPGVFKNIAKTFGLRVETLDLDPELKPDHVGSATDMPFSDNTFDIVCAFQMLEHLPYEESLKVFNQMNRVAGRNIVISLPDAKVNWRYSFHLPKVGIINWLVPKPTFGLKAHTFDGEHYWEINKAEHPLNKILADFSSIAELLKTYRVPENPYHRFFIFKKRA